MSAIVMIPARINSTRLQGKILELIDGKPMILHVAERAIAADVGPVVVAVDHQSVFDVVAARNIHCVMTSNAHDCGTDRIGEAVDRLDPHGHYQTVINVQADVPTINPLDIRAAVAQLEPRGQDECDIATLAYATSDYDLDSLASPHVVKVIGTPLPDMANAIRALYFTRGLPWGHGTDYHHIGLYAYRRHALNRLRRLPRGTLERREGLEQLRALECGMMINVALVAELPISVDTPADLDRVRESLKRIKP